MSHIVLLIGLVVFGVSMYNAGRTKGRQQGFEEGCAYQIKIK